MKFLVSFLALAVGWFMCSRWRFAAWKWIKWISFVALKRWTTVPWCFVGRGWRWGQHWSWLPAPTRRTSMCGSMVEGGPLTVNQSGGSCAGQDSISWPPWSAIPESLRPPFHQELQERKGLLWWVCLLHGSLGGMLSWQVRRPMHQQRQEFCKAIKTWRPQWDAP